MPIRSALPFVLCAATSLAFAAPPRSDNIDLKKNMEFAARITLLKPGGGKPKLTPLRDNSEVQLRLDKAGNGTSGTVPCTLSVPKKIGQIAAGESAVIGMKCGEEVNLPRQQLGFTVLDNGREIGSGAFRP